MSYRVIPAIRREMTAVVNGPDLSASEYKTLIAEWIPRLVRRKPLRRTPNSTKRTQDAMALLKEKAIVLAQASPNLNYQEIAYAIGAKNIGRVSEWISGTPAPKHD